MGKISDIWVRLGLKKEGFDKGMDAAEKKAEGFGETFGKVKAKALAAWAAIGTAVVTLGKNFIQNSQIMSDKWNVGMNQMKSAWGQFLSTLTSWDWEGFGQRMRDAMSAAAESTASHDAEFEVMNSIKLRKAAISEELAQLDILMRDTRKNYDERAKAAQDYLDKVRPLYQAEIDLRKRIYLSDTSEYLKNAGLQDTAGNRDLLRTFLTDIAPNDSLVAVLNEYQKKVQGKKKYELSPEDYKTIDAFYEQYGNKGGAALSVLAQYYQSSNNDVANKVVDAIAGYDSSKAQFNEATRRIQTIMNTAMAQSADDIETDTLAEVDHLKETLDQIRDDWEMEPIFDPVVDGPEIDLSGLDRAEAEIDSFLAKWKEQQAQTAELNGMLEDALISSMGNGLQAITDMMMGIQGADAKSVLAAFIAPFGDMAKNMGAMIMSYGISMDAFKKAFTKPYVAIAAGAGLMAIGAAISSGAQRLSQGSLGGGATSSYSGGSYGTNPELNYESTLTVEVVGRLSGSDIILAGQNQQNKWNR